MKKEYTCIICPNGCELAVEIEGTEIIAIEGAACSKGTDYVRQELVDPRRNIATSVLVANGDIPLVSVRLSNPIPKAEIFAVVNEIKKVKLTAPVMLGQVIIKNVLGLNADVIATKQVGVKRVS
ncbi:DUF1667 domain-containing protein [Sporomusa sphaeroides]|uniref:DUF1667 domain-containing protein n=1 Tax=Sporomusa sphaeroides TaxID=47679 RepID=UPI003DA0AAEA